MCVGGVHSQDFGKWSRAVVGLGRRLGVKGLGEGGGCDQGRRLGCRIWLWLGGRCRSECGAGELSGDNLGPDMGMQEVVKCNSCLAGPVGFLPAASPRLKATGCSFHV